MVVNRDIRPSDWVKWFSISSKDLFLVSGTRKRENSSPKAETAAYSQNTP